MIGYGRILFNVNLLSDDSFQTNEGRALEIESLEMFQDLFLHQS